METKSGYIINYAYASIVPALKLIGNSVEKIDSKLLDFKEKGFKYLVDIFDNATSECKIEINFKSSDQQHNDVRTQLLNILKEKEIEKKKTASDTLAEKLSKVTDERNKEGLFIILIGKKLKTFRIVLIRFRGEEVVIKRETKDSFTIDYVGNAYSKKSKFYKAVYYEDQEADRGNFWKGYTIDRQIGQNNDYEVSAYWIHDFLESEFAMTSFQGTLHFAKVIREFSKQVEDPIEQGIFINSILALNQNTDIPISLNSFADHYLQNPLREKFLDSISDKKTAEIFFSIDREMYVEQLGIKVIKMDNGIFLALPNFLTNNQVSIKEIPDGKKEFTITGKILKQRIRKTGTNL